MPTIERFDRFKICMYADDHPPPHFYVIGKGFAFVVLLDGLKVEAGRYPTGIHAEVIAWAAANLEDCARHGRLSMSEAEMIQVGDPLPTVAAVEAGSDPFTVVVTWGEGARAGTQDAVDLASILMTYKVFAPLRDDRALFATVRVSEFGEAIEWGDDDDLALSATTLERLAEEMMTNADFAAFLKRNGLTRDAAAGQLGIARRLVSYYAKNRAIPRYIMLACRSLDGRIGRRDMRPPADGIGTA